MSLTPLGHYGDKRMTKEKFIELMNDDLRQEYTHMHFYLHAASRVMGVSRRELAAFFREEAVSELNHVLEFSNAILAIGGIPTPVYDAIKSDLSDPDLILKEILDMEQFVVERYANRIDEAELLGGSTGKYLMEFYANQLMDSKKTVHEISLMGFN